MSEPDEPDERDAFTPARAQAAWDDFADAWDAFVQGGFDYYRIQFHGPALLDACGDVAGRDALDLGCGQGWFSRQLAGAGARVTGVDWSPRLIAHAVRHQAGAPAPIRYLVLDAARVAERLPAASFDLVTGCMSLMDMPEPAKVLAGARALLRPGGRVVVSVPNPVTDSPYRVWKRDADGEKLALELDRYFEATTTWTEWTLKNRPFPSPEPHRTVQYRFTLESWSRMIEDAGFLIRRLREPRPSDEVLAKTPALADATRLPYILIFELCPAP